MNKSPAVIKHNNDIDIKTVCLDILRDLYSASRKLMMYPVDHPVANETIKKPLERLNDIFAFKRSFVIQVYNNRLVAEGLLLEENVFVNGLLIDLTRHNINSVVFTADVGMGDLFHFLGKLNEDKSPLDGYFQKYLQSKNITNIIINKPDLTTLYNFEDTVIGARKTGFLLDDRLFDILQNTPDILMAYYLGKIKTDNDVIACTGIDIRFHYLTRYFTPIITEMTEDKALDIFRKVIYSGNWLDETTNQDVLEGLHRLWEDYARRSEDISILLPVYDIFKSVGAPEDVLDVIFNKGALLKLKAVIDAENFIKYLKKSQAREIDFQLLRKTVFKLATESYSRPLENLLGQLSKSLLAKDLDTRQRGLRLTIEALQTLTDGSFWEISNAFIGEILRLLHSNEPGPEIIELIGWIMENSAHHGRWEELKICGQTLISLTRLSPDDYKRKLAVDRLEELAESSVMTDILIDAVISGKGDAELYQAIAALASLKIASILIQKIDRGDKSERARIIKALVYMGKGVGPELNKVLAEIVGEGEENENKNWYKLRNLLRVIGRIKYVEALPYFKILAGWPSIRLKREIISSCEAIAMPAAGLILSRLALDIDSDVRKAAVVAMGISGHPDMVNYLKELFNDPRSDKILIVAALGRIDGHRARDILIDLYENETIYVELDIGKKEEQNIKLAILKSLSKIGDDVSKSKMQLYSSRGKNKLFKKDVLSQTAAILLGDVKK